MTKIEIVYRAYLRGILVLAAVGFANLAFVVPPMALWLTGLMAITCLLSALIFFPYPSSLKTREQRREVSKDFKYPPIAWLFIVFCTAMVGAISTMNKVPASDIVHYCFAALMFSMVMCSAIYCLKLRTAFQSG